MSSDTVTTATAAAAAEVDPVFAVSTRWILQMAQDHCFPASKPGKELALLTAEQGWTLSPDCVRALCAGHVYALVLHHCRPTDELHPITSIYQEPDATAYVVKALKSVPEATSAELCRLLANCAEFGSSRDAQTAHARIQTALIDSSVAAMSKPMLATLCTYLAEMPHYSVYKHSPFDIEDAFLVWMSLEAQASDGQPRQLDDLLTDARMPDNLTHLLKAASGRTVAASYEVIDECIQSKLKLPWLPMAKWAAVDDDKTLRSFIMLAMSKLFDLAQKQKQKRERGTARKVRLKKGTVRQVGDSASSLTESTESIAAPQQAEDSQPPHDTVVLRASTTEQPQSMGSHHVDEDPREQQAELEDLQTPDVHGYALTNSTHTKQYVSQAVLPTSHTAVVSAQEENLCTSAYVDVSQQPQIPEEHDSDIDALLQLYMSIDEEASEGPAMTILPQEDKGVGPPMNGDIPGEEYYFAAAENEVDQRTRSARSTSSATSNLHPQVDWHSVPTTPQAITQPATPPVRQPSRQRGRSLHVLRTPVNHHDVSPEHSAERPATSSRPATARRELPALTHRASESALPSPTPQTSNAAELRRSWSSSRTVDLPSINGTTNPRRPLSLKPASASSSSSSSFLPRLSSTSSIVSTTEPAISTASSEVVSDHLVPSSPSVAATQRSRPPSTLQSDQAAESEEEVEAAPPPPPPPTVEDEKARLRKLAMEARRLKLMEKLEQHKKQLDSKTDASPHGKARTEAEPAVNKSPVKRKSNRQLIINALNVCLAGELNVETKQQVLQDMEETGFDNFVILMRDLKNHSFKGLYTFDEELSQVLRLYGTGPDELLVDDVAGFFKYDSGSRSFKELPARTFSIAIHAVAVKSAFSSKKKKQQQQQQQQQQAP
ncbi:hypothetical protein RI367_002280 [Sorochytrium milnesiophthora]